MPPVSGMDYTLQIQNAVRELDDMEDDLSYDVFFLYWWVIIIPLWLTTSLESCALLCL